MPFTASLTFCIIEAGFIWGPDGILMGSFIPEASIFTLEPPISITRIFSLRLPLALTSELDVWSVSFFWEFRVGVIVGCVARLYFSTSGLESRGKWLCMHLDL